MIVFDHLNKVSKDHGLYAKNADLVCICKTKNQTNKEANKNLDWHTDTHPFLLCVWGIWFFIVVFIWFVVFLVLFV